MVIESLLFDPKLKGMLVPFGFYKNAALAEAYIGQVVYTMDEPPEQVKIMAKAVISIKSQVAEALSLMLYGKSIDYIFNKMLKNWKSDIFTDMILFLVVEKYDEY